MKRKKPDEAAINNRRLISEARSKFYAARAEGVSDDEAAADASRFYRDALGAGVPKAEAMLGFIKNLNAAPFMTEQRARETVRDEISMPAPGKIPAPPNLGEPHPYDAVEIPADLDAFKALTWPQRKSLASKISETPIKDIASAEAAFVAEMDRRAK